MKSVITVDEMENINTFSKFYHEEIEPFMYKGLVGPFTIYILLAVIEYGSLHSINQRISELFYVYFVSLLILNAAVAILLWYIIFRRQNRFKGDEVGILIALTKLDKRTDSELEKLYSKISHLIETKKFKSRVVVRFVPSFLIPKNENGAHKLRDQLNAQLIIWGNVDYGNLNSQPQTIFIPIFFSYKIPLPSDRAALIAKGFQHVLANRKWMISESNSAIDRDYLAQNLEEVSLYFIGAVLYFSRRNNESLEIMKEVLKKYKSKSLLTIDDDIAIKNIRILIFEIFKFSSKQLNLGPRSTRLQKDIPLAEKLVAEQKGVDEIPSALLLESQIEFAKGSTTKALSKAKEAYSLTPNVSPACFSLAFLYFYSGDLPQGWMWLKRAVKKGDKSKVRDQLPLITAWYEDTLKLEPNKKLYLNFPLGVIYFEYLGEAKNSEESLEIFLKKYKGVNDKEFRPFIIESERILKKIKKSKTKRA